MPRLTTARPSSARVLLPAALLLPIACADRVTGRASGPPERLQVIAGDAQSGVVGQPLPASLVVRVVDDKGKPVQGQIVNFRVTRGGGTVYAGAAISNPDGIAREQWTLGTAVADSQVVEARAVDPATGAPLLFATFRATPRPDRAATLDVAPSDTVDDLAVPVRLTAVTADRYGNPAADPIAWRVADTTVARVVPDSTGSGAVVFALRAGTVAVIASTGTLSDSARVTFRGREMANRWRTVAFDPSVSFGVAWTSPSGSVYVVGQRTVTVVDSATGGTRSVTNAALYRAQGSDGGEQVVKLTDIPNAGLFTCIRTGSCLGGIAGTSDSDIWIGFTVPAGLYHWNGATLTASNPFATVTDVVAADDGKVYATLADSAGWWLVQRRDPGDWVTVDTVRGDLLRSLWVGGGVVYGGGQQRRSILRYRAGVWDSIPQPVGTGILNLPDVLRGRSANEVYWVRDSSQVSAQVVMRWDGSQSSVVTSIRQATSFGSIRTGDLWIDGESGDLVLTGGECQVHYVPAANQQMAQVIQLPACAGNPPKAVTGRSRSDLWVFGLGGLVAHGTYDPRATMNVRMLAARP